MNNIFKNIDKSSDKKTISLTNKEKSEETKKNVIKDIREYVKVRIEMGIFQPIELTDVYSLDIYIGIQIPREINVELNGDIVTVNRDDFIVFDFNGNVSCIKNKDFSSFYKYSKISEYQQLLSAIRLFDIKAKPDEIFIKINYNKTLHDSEDAVFDKLTEMIMNGQVEDDLMKFYKDIIDKKYNDVLINYTVLSDFKAKYLVKKLKEKNIPFALISPLVDSIVQIDEEGDLDVDRIIGTSNYMAAILTAISAAPALKQSIEEMNAELFGKAHCIDTLSLDELVGFNSQFQALGLSIPGINIDKIKEQMKQEAMEEFSVYGNDEISKETDDIFL